MFTSRHDRRLKRAHPLRTAWTKIALASLFKRWTFLARPVNRCEETPVPNAACLTVQGLRAWYADAVRDLRGEFGRESSFVVAAPGGGLVAAPQCPVRGSHRRCAPPGCARS